MKLGNEQAFPIITHKEIVTIPGMSKREYFAAIAMQGLLAGAKEVNKSLTAYAAIEYADALIIKLKELEE